MFKGLFDKCLPPTLVITAPVMTKNINAQRIQQLKILNAHKRIF